MLKKVMIICLAFSFVFIGGIAFAGNEGPEPVVIPGEQTDLSTDDSDTAITEEEGVKNEVEEKVEVEEEGH